MEHIEAVIISLLVAVAFLSALATRIGIPYPILLVVGGLALGFAPGIPDVRPDPDLVLGGFLPPLLYSAAFFANLRELRYDARTITLTSTVLVVATATAVAVAIHALVEDLPWAVAFALGAIVAPTDPVAATQILRRFDVPRRLVNTIEGEALINDASALVLYRIAVAALGGGAGAPGARAVRDRRGRHRRERVLADGRGPSLRRERRGRRGDRARGRGRHPRAALA